MATSFLMDANGKPHERGNRSCPACWDTYPDECDLQNPACSGLMHAHATEMRGDKQMIESRCDQCGRDAVGRST